MVKISAVSRTCSYKVQHAQAANQITDSDVCVHITQPATAFLGVGCALFARAKTLGHCPLNPSLHEGHEGLVRAYGNQLVSRMAKDHR